MQLQLYALRRKSRPSKARRTYGVLACCWGKAAGGVPSPGSGVSNDCVVRFMYKKSLVSVPVAPTSHGCGLKRVLLSCGDTTAAITQIAVTKLKAGETAGAHVHPTMEEYFLVRKGRVMITVAGEAEELGPDDFVRIEAGTEHGMEAVTDCELLSVGCAV